MPFEPARVLFVYWGRRGALPQFTREVFHAARQNPRVAPAVSVSRQIENYQEFSEFGAELFAIDTFRANAGAVSQSWRIPILRRRLYEQLRQDRTHAVIELMPHVWSPFVMPVVRAAGARYCTVIHDADAHTGDKTGWVKGVLDRSMRSADVVFTLSEAVANRLSETGKVPHDKLVTLFHPDLSYSAPVERAAPVAGEPLRLLFLGRILPYKGLPLFLDMVDRLRGEGIAVEAGVFGEGDLGSNAARLERMGAEVVNRWLSESEIAAILPRYHAMVLSHTEASQSGVAAAAFGAALPVIATPVGGLVEQVRDGETGILAHRADAGALAAAAKRLLLDADFYSATCQTMSRLASQRSMTRFVDEIVEAALRGR